MLSTAERAGSSEKFSGIVGSNSELVDKSPPSGIPRRPAARSGLRGLRCVLHTPDLGEYALEISSQNLLDVGVRVSAPDQAFRQVKGALRVVESLDVVLFAEGIAGLVAAVELLADGLGQRVVTVEPDVAPDAQMLHAHQVSHMVVMVQHVFDGSGF